ncbi:hypothetical protein FOZ63_016700, partial [Perkinsus olseni]
LVGPEAKEAIAAGTTFTGKVVPLLMSPDSPPGVVDLGWALAASLTVVKSVKYEVWDSGADLFEHALERLGTERPVSHVLRHVIQVVANLQELPSIREWFLKHGAAEILDSIITEEGQDCMVVKLATTTAELLRYRP